MTFNRPIKINLEENLDAYDWAIFLAKYYDLNNDEREAIVDDLLNLRANEIYNDYIADLDERIAKRFYEDYELYKHEDTKKEPETVKKPKGCKNCPGAPKTYEEFCIVKNRVKYNEFDELTEWGLCPDAFSDVSPLCGNYDQSM